MFIQVTAKNVGGVFLRHSVVSSRFVKFIHSFIVKNGTSKRFSAPQYMPVIVVQLYWNVKSWMLNIAIWCDGENTSSYIHCSTTTGDVTTLHRGWRMSRGPRCQEPQVFFNEEIVYFFLSGSIAPELHWHSSTAEKFSVLQRDKKERGMEGGREWGNWKGEMGREGPQTEFVQGSKYRVTPQSTSEMH